MNKEKQMTQVLVPNKDIKEEIVNEQKEANT